MRERELQLILELHRATHQLGLYIDGLVDVGVSQAEAIILVYLRRARSATMSQVHRAFGHKRSTLTSIVDRLVARGLAVRNSSLRDRRSFTVTLTRKGAAVASTLRERFFMLEAKALKGIPDRDVKAFHKVIQRLVASSNVEKIPRTGDLR